MECRKPAAIDRATALRYMGASGWTPDAATAALLDKAEQTVLTAAAPRAVYRRLPRTVSAARQSASFSSSGQSP